MREREKYNTENPQIFSDWYGGVFGGQAFNGVCEPGAWMGSVTMFTKSNGTVDGLTGDCIDTKGNVTRLIDDGDRHDDGVVGQRASKKKSKAVAVLAEVARFVGTVGVDILGTVLAPFTFGASEAIALGVNVGIGFIPGQKYGRQQYLQGGLAAPQGMDRVLVWTRNVDNHPEIAAIQIWSVDGKTTGIVGGNMEDGKERPKYAFKCPAGTVITGVRGRSGERMNAVQFKCARPMPK